MIFNFRSSAQEGERILTHTPFARPTGSASLVNTDRLPSPEELRKTEVAHREQLTSDDEARRIARRFVLWRIILGPPLLFALIMTSLFVKWIALWVFAASVIVALGRVLLFGKRDSRTLLKILFLPTGLVIAGSWLQTIVGNPSGSLLGRMLFIVAAMTLFFSLFLTNSGPGGFGWDWLSRDQVFTPAGRRFLGPNGHLMSWTGLVDREFGPHRNRIIGGAITAILLLGGYGLLYSQLIGHRDSWDLIAMRQVSDGELNEGRGLLTLATIFTVISVAVLLVFFRRNGPAGKLLGQYLRYDGDRSGAPGVWRPPQTAQRRRTLLTAQFASFAVAYFLGTGFLLGRDPDQPFSSYQFLFRTTDRVIGEVVNGSQNAPVAAPSRTSPSTPAPGPREMSNLENDARAFVDSVAAAERRKQEENRSAPMGSVQQADSAMRGLIKRDTLPDPSLTLASLTFIPAQFRATIRPTPSPSPTPESTSDFQDPSLLENAAAVLTAFIGAGGIDGNISVQRVLLRPYAYSQHFALLLFISIVTLTPLLVLLLLPSMLQLELMGWAHKGYVAWVARTPWECAVTRVRESEAEFEGPDGETIREKEHLFLGIEPNANYPVLLDQKLLGEHTYIVGDSGSGKTSLGIMPMVMQLMRDGTDPIVIIDLKGDTALYNMVRNEAESRRRKFLFFTPEYQKASHYFNPFENFERSSRTLSSFATLFLDALSLNHGEGYGRGYFTARNRQLLFSVLKANPNVKNFEELYNLLTADKNAKEDVFELVATMQMLSDYKKLNTPWEDVPEDQVIHMARLLEQREIAYFFLPAAIESISVREIGKLALFSLMSAAIARQREGKEPRQVYVVIDEFQRLAGENFSILLEQARSFGISLILANQTISDLNTHSKDLRPSIRTNTRAKMFFSVTEPEELSGLSSLSGQALMETRSRGTTRGSRSLLPQHSESESFSEQLVPRLSPQTIQLISDHPHDFLLLVSRGRGLTQFGGLPVHVRTSWPISFDEYNRLRTQPWPEPPKDERERIASGLEVEEVTIKERERTISAYSREQASKVAASIAGYFELRQVEDPDALVDPREQQRNDKLQKLFEDGQL